MNALEVKNLNKTFGKIEAVKNVSFNIPEGAIFGLIGRNGAGKTTTIRMMMNIYMPDKGEVILRGTKVGEEFRSKVGYLPEERGLYKKMKVLDTLLFFAEMKGAIGKEVKEKALKYLERFDLLERKDSKIEDLSKGNQQKVQFIATILHDPDFIILDEPFSGLDPINTNHLKDIILEMKAKGKVIILSTHLMDFAERLCDNIAIINKGEVILEGSLTKIKEDYGKGYMSIACDGDISYLKNNTMVESVTNMGNLIGIKVKETSQTQEILKSILEKNIPIKRFTANEISLQEIFVKLTGDDKEVTNA